MITATQARERRRLRPVRLAEITLLNGGPTLHLSDRNIESGGQRYEGYLDKTAFFDEGMDLEFRNGPFRGYGSLVEIGQEYPFEGAGFTMSEVYLDDDGTPSEAETVFKGVLGEPTDIGPMGFRCRAAAMEFARDRAWHQPIVDATNWPNAHEDVGEVEPFVYGYNIRVPALRVDWGARTTLQSGISKTTTTFVLSEPSRFPGANFDVWIDDEKVHVALRSPTGTCTGCTRGYGGTTATAHRAGADVVEVKGQYDSLLAGHELYDVGDIFAEIRNRLWRVTAGVSAVYAGGRHLLRATDHIRVQALDDGIGVDDGISVGDDIGITVGGSSKTVYPDGHSCYSQFGGVCSSPESAHDGNEASYCQVRKYQLGDNSSASVTLEFPDTNYGAIQTQRVWARVAGSDVTVIGGWSPSSVSAPSAAWYEFTKSGGDWDDTITFGHGTEFNAYIYEVRKEVDYTSTTSKTGSAYRSGAVAKTGGVVATHTVERFHAAVSGAVDPDGGYGGMGSLIERPDHVIRHFLVERAGFSPGDIDSGSFDAAGSEYDSSGYAFAFRVGEKIVPSEFIGEMARQCRSALRCVHGKWLLEYLPDTAPAAIKTVSADELAGERSAFRFARTPVSALSNGLTARFSRNYSRMRGESAWDATVSAGDPASQTKYGPYIKEVDLGLVRDGYMAVDVLDHMLLRRKEPRLTVTFPVFWEHFDLEPGDTVEIDSAIYGGRKFLIESVRRTDKFRAVITANEWW